MLNRRIYYAVKPFFPWRVRREIRSVFARRKRASCTSIWPIDERTARPPAHWPGWPEGKQFAVVLTHDVEGAKGLEKFAKLAELEESLGFRSSFNFIPEGRYRVSKAQRDFLTENGFEVGVHDLHHNGKLFHTEKSFQRSAEKINRYINEWGASGFRAGFMLRNLDWMHRLDVSYDASTFDTDPFEPMPDGAGTIFPFWRPAPRTAFGPLKERAPRGTKGYVELPYTLPQDSTLFLILQEQGPDIWIKKLDWLARNGGMALVNVHPDYIQFPGDAPSARSFPAEHYAKFLRHVRDNYAGQYWQPLPRQVAEYVIQLQSPPVLRTSKRIGMVTHSSYLSDNRVRRYAESLAARGDEVDVFSLSDQADQPREETVSGVRVVRIQNRFGKQEHTKLQFLLPLVAFLARATWHITREHSRKPYDCLHVHNVPDFLVFSGLYPKLTGKKIILDVHDVVPEFFSSKFAGGQSKGLTFWLLRKMEAISARFANHVIIANDLWREKYAARTRSEKKCTAYINNVDTRLFFPRPRTRNDGKLIVLFPGGLQWHQGVDLAIKAFPKVRAALPNAEFHIYGGGGEKDALVVLTKELALEHCVRFFAGTRLDHIVKIMAAADLGVVPKRADTFGNEAYSTKIMEFMSVGVPVVVSSTKVDRFYFNERVVKFFESGNVEALASVIIETLSSAEIRRSLVGNALQYVEKNNWNSRKADYLRLVDGLCRA